MELSCVFPIGAGKLRAFDKSQFNSKSHTYGRSSSTRNRHHRHVIATSRDSAISQDSCHTHRSLQPEFLTPASLETSLCLAACTKRYTGCPSSKIPQWGAETSKDPDTSWEETKLHWCLQGTRASSFQHAQEDPSREPGQAELRRKLLPTKSLTNKTSPGCKLPR